MTDDVQKNDVISTETSKRICSHMNDDHAVSVHAMAKSLLGSGYGKITEANLKEVNMDGCTIAVVTCKGDLCEMKKLTYSFDPPLKSASEVRPRMVEIHHQVCAPRVSWLFTDMFALSVLIVVALLGYGTHVVGVEALMAKIENSAHLNSAISLFFGSASTFSNLVRYSWFLALFLHDLEAFYVLYHARQTLKLNGNAQILWYILVAAVGFPITREFLDLLKVHQKKSNNKKAD